ncbi:MAG TPA: hydroxysqualene dehydroxylase HpnE [Ignavibacteriaceae bacterium]|nr:hydroxysqualene dehydroxylase HpnE [Ignavibacteriaceae bacterium]
MPDCIVIGGGFAGLSAAVHLTRKGKKVELIEASQKLGGRAYSLTDKLTNTIIDNGQHIMMGCYRETFEFFKIIDAQENLISQDKLKVNFLQPFFKLVPLEVTSGPYPFNLAAGLLNYKAISFKDRLLMLKFFLKLPLSSSRDLSKITVYEWLENENQNEKIRKAFWEILAVGALNTSIYKASAKVFKDILIEIFFRGNNAAVIILPGKGLTETYCDKAKSYIEERGGKVITGETVNALTLEGNKVGSIITNKRVIKKFKYLISAIPFYALERLLPVKDLIPDPGFSYSSILTVHIWLKENKIDKTFYGLIDSDIHWIFNKGTHLTLVRSDANDLMEKSKEEIFEMVKKELYRYCFIEENDISDYRIIKEKRSTFIPSNDLQYKRPSSDTILNNFYLAGDWINTGLPSTIESAVKSGKMSAAEIK